MFYFISLFLGEPGNVIIRLRYDKKSSEDSKKGKENIVREWKWKSLIKEKLKENFYKHVIAPWFLI